MYLQEALSLFLGQLSMNPWNSLGYWLWDRSLSGLSSRLCGLRLAKSCRFWPGAFRLFWIHQIARRRTWSPILSNYTPIGLPRSLMNLFVFIMCSHFNKFANT